MVLTVGLTGCAAWIVGAAFAPSFELLLLFLALAGASGAAVNSASGRAGLCAMHWFGANERGLALGLRQTAIPIGGFVGALAVPPIANAGGSEAAFLFLAGLCAAGALAGALVSRERESGDELEVASILRTLGDAKLWRLSVGSGFYLYAQLAVIGFAVLFLHDEHGLSEGGAALVIAASQVLAMAFRIGAGRWSTSSAAAWPASPSRARCRRLGGAHGRARQRPLWLLVPAIALAGGLSMAWNGLSTCCR